MAENHTPAPPNNLPRWEDCALRVSNSDFIAKRVAEGGYGAEPDSLLATDLHRFIYEYDDMDPYRSGWFMHRLELVLNEARAEALQTKRERLIRKEPVDVDLSHELHATLYVLHPDGSISPAAVRNQKVNAAGVSPSLAPRPFAHCDCPNCDATGVSLPDHQTFRASDGDGL